MAQREIPLEVCAICHGKELATRITDWNHAPTCEDCYTAITSIALYPDKDDHEEAKALIEKATERARTWLEDYNKSREEYDRKAHESGKRYLKFIFEEE